MSDPNAATVLTRRSTVQIRDEYAFYQTFLDQARRDLAVVESASRMRHEEGRLPDSAIQDAVMVALRAVVLVEAAVQAARVISPLNLQAAAPPPPPASPLVIRIARALGGIQLLDSTTDWHCRIRFRSIRSGNLYLMRRHIRSGQWDCSCKDWVCSRRCWHMDEVRAVLAAEGMDDPVAADADANA